MKEWRMACTGKGAGHSKHKWPKKNAAKANQSAIDANHHAEQHPDHFYNRVCAPYVVETREVSNWAEPLTVEPPLILDDLT